MQDKSIEKHSQAERLRRLYLKRQCNWDVIAADLDLKEPTIYAVLNGTRNLSEKAEHRLARLELEAGIINYGGAEPAPVLDFQLTDARASWEIRILEKMRGMTPPQRDAVIQIIEVVITILPAKPETPYKGPRSSSKLPSDAEVLAHAISPEKERRG